MQIISKIESIKAQLSLARKNNNTIGFVPTMGALHKGHLTLIEQAKRENNKVVVSIYVNPTQFNDKSDFARYPRILDKDKSLLEYILDENDIIFAPKDTEMYPEPDTRIFDLHELDKTMEGAHRPGHFNGVAQIVTKLFDIVMPDKAYFGEKDFQQLAIIKHLVKTLHYPIEIISCKTIREDDGLAMSSRNALLTDEQRKNAVLISQTLSKSKDFVKKIPLQEFKDWVINQINTNPFLETEYFELSDSQTLHTIYQWESSKEIIACIAVKVGKIRLIDNIKLFV